MHTTNHRRASRWSIAGVVMCGIVISAQGGATVELFEFGVNGDATIYTSEASLPSYVNASAFDFGTGLGKITATFGDAGAHYFALYVDHEIDQAINTFFNEYGEAVNTPKTTQTWEIDEPGFVYGDIYANFLAGALDNSNGVPASAPDDVAMALAWGFTVGSAETATIQMQVGENTPAAGFYLAQTDPDSRASIYFSSTLAFGPTGVPDGGSTCAFLAFALLALGGLRRKLTSHPCSAALWTRS